MLSDWQVSIDQDGQTFGSVDAPYIQGDPSPHLIAGRAFFDLFMVGTERPAMQRPFVARFEPVHSPGD
jgi:hypothetical protein